jgi:PAS domain S-box-containing protein
LLVAPRQGEDHAMSVFHPAAEGVNMTDVNSFSPRRAPPADASPPVDASSGCGAPLRKRAQSDRDRAAWHYAAIIESSDDAILSMDLDGVIHTWNAGAERLFGFTAAETVGRPVMIIIPDDRLGEEPALLDKIRRGERIRQFETVRRRKDGSLVDISLTVSPIRDSQGRIVATSKIARDISELRKTRERQQLLLREMNHRVKNLFALTGSIIGLSARSAKSVQQLAESARERLAALARAHALTFSHGEPSPQPTTLQSLIRAIVAPFDEPEAPRIAISGVDVPVSGGAVASLALLLHEFATNAAKYGALSSIAGTIAIDCVAEGENITVIWIERGGPTVVQPTSAEGFGGVLSRIALMSQLGGEITRDWKPEGLEIRLAAPRVRLAD